MEKIKRAKNLLIELEALKEQDPSVSPIGTALLVSIALADAEVLARQVLTEVQLGAAVEARRLMCRRSGLSLIG